MRERPVPERPPTYCVFAIYYFVIGDKSYNFYNFPANYYYDFSDLDLGEPRTSGWSLDIGLPRGATRAWLPTRLGG